MIYIAGIVLACFLSLILFTQRHKTAAVNTLATWLVVIGLHLSGFYLFTYEYYLQYPSLVTLTFAFPLLHGPFLYLYTRLQTVNNRFSGYQLFHFLPFGAALLIFLPYHLLPFQQRVEIFKLKGQGFETELLLNSLTIYASGITYCALSLSALIKYRRQLPNEFSNTERINYSWLLYLIIWMIVIWLVVLTMPSSEVLYTMVVLFVFWIGYFGIRQARVFIPVVSIVDDQKRHEPQRALATASADIDTRYQKSSLTKEQATIIFTRLMAIMDEKQPFRNPELTLTNLADMLEVHPNVLSQVINTCGSQTFYELVNEKRINTFILLVKEPKYAQYTFLALAMDCGFNSKASFNRNFKKYTGLTPSEYVKQNRVGHADS